MSDITATLTGRHVLVTGASRGIGADIAARLAADGVRISLLGRDTALLAAVAAKLGGAAHAIPIAADVTDAASVKKAFASARRQFGPVHILVNNAGQAAAAKFTDTDETLWHRIIGVNLTGTYLCTREAVPDMLQAGFGRIVNIASIAGLRGRSVHIRLCDIEACGDRPHALPGLGVCDTEHHRERGMSRIHRYRHREAGGRQHREEDRPQRKRGDGNPDRHQPAAAPDRPGGGEQRRSLALPPGTESVTGQSIVIAGGEVTT